MASRDTKQEAENLREEIQARYPSARIIIEDTSSTRRIGRIVAEEKGFEIIEDNGGLMVVVKETRYDVLEARQCDACESEYHTIAIGEADDGKCPVCSKTAEAEWKQELAVRVEQEKERQRELNWRNDQEE